LLGDLDASCERADTAVVMLPAAIDLTVSRRLCGQLGAVLRTLASADADRLLPIYASLEEALQADAPRPG
jgi:hypothetical protein